MSSLHATHHSPPHPHPTGGPAGGHQQADPDRQDRSSAMKDRSAHGGGSPEAPRTSPRSPRRMRARWRTRRGLSQPRRRPGGLEQSDLGFFSFCFFLFCAFWWVWGEGDLGDTPTMTAQASPGVGNEYTGGKCSCCPARGSGKPLP